MVSPVLRVLFVCTGNTCRSPMAAGALLQELGDERAQVEVSSAGTAAWEGQPATEEAIAVAGADGIDLGGHRSRRVTAAALEAADLVLVMEGGQVGTVQALGASRKRTHVLSEWPEPGEPGLPVSDPFGASREAYEECWRRIRHHVRRLVPQVREALRARSM
ncbi:MAG TPA: low molecular weight protein arginine phosphatase [Candidatus Eisenbacteria bacterium]|jgi:protein-tyrosine-phosphatase